MCVRTVHIIKITVAKRKVRLSFDFDKDLIAGIKQLPGARWNKKERVWELPASPHIVTQLMETIQAKSCMAIGDASFDALLESGKIAEAATYKKDAEERDLPQPATRKTDAWLHQLRGFHFAMELLGCSAEGGDA